MFISPVFSGPQTASPFSLVGGPEFDSENMKKKIPQHKVVCLSHKKSPKKASDCDLMRRKIAIALSGVLLACNWSVFSLSILNYMRGHSQGY